MYLSGADPNSAGADPSGSILCLSLSRDAAVHVHLGPPPVAAAPAAPVATPQRRAVVPVLLTLGVVSAVSFGAGRLTSSPPTLRPAIAAADAMPSLQRMPIMPPALGSPAGPFAALLGSQPASRLPRAEPPARRMPADPLAAIRQGLASPPTYVPPPAAHTPGEHPFGFQN